MKNPRLIIPIVFLTFLITGVWTGVRHSMANSSPLSFAPTSLVTGEMPTLDNGQRNILLIAVDNLKQSKPRLEAIWMVTYSPSQTSVNLWPVYPTTAQGQVSLDSEIAQAFSINQQEGVTSISQNLFDILTSRNFWWSGYLLLDRYAMGKVIDLIGGIVIDDNVMSGNDILKTLVHTVKDPNLAFHQQSIILNQTCKAALTPGLSLEQNLIPALESDHFATNMDTNLIMSEWQMMVDNSQDWTCDFPLTNLDP